MQLSCIVLEIQRVICRKSPILTYPTPIWRPRWGCPRWNFAEIFGIRKLRVSGVGLSRCVVCKISCIAVLVADRQTDTLLMSSGNYRQHGAKRMYSGIQFCQGGAQIRLCCATLRLVLCLVMCRDNDKSNRSAVSLTHQANVIAITTLYHIH